MWDIGGDQFDSCDGAGVLEITSLSLDESNMEKKLFIDDAENKAVETIIT